MAGLKLGYLYAPWETTRKYEPDKKREIQEGLKDYEEFINESRWLTDESVYCAHLLNLDKFGFLKKSKP
jgi:hypothetical protein